MGDSDDVHYFIPELILTHRSLSLGLKTLKELHRR